MAEVKRKVGLQMLSEARVYEFDSAFGVLMKASVCCRALAGTFGG